MKKGSQSGTEKAASHDVIPSEAKREWSGAEGSERCGMQCSRIAPLRFASGSPSVEMTAGMPGRWLHENGVAPGRLSHESMLQDPGRLSHASGVPPRRRDGVRRPPAHSIRPLGRFMPRRGLGRARRFPGAFFSGGRFHPMRSYAIMESVKVGRCPSGRRRTSRSR